MALIKPENQDKAMKAFQDRMKFESRQRDLERQMKMIESIPNQLRHIDFQLNVVGAKMEESNQNREEFGKLVKELGHLKKRREAIEDFLGNQSVIEKRAEIEEAQNKLLKEQSKGPFWDNAGLLGIECDRMLVNMQRENLRGMYFAPEAHLSEGAFGAVVLDMQKLEYDVRTPNQLMQAFREVHGFYTAHQTGENNQTKMANAAKYAIRLNTIINALKERCRILGISLPEVSVMTDINAFFSGIAGSREKSENERTKEVNTLAEKYFEKENVLEDLNTRMENIAVTLEAWISTLDSKDKNAYY